MNFDPYLSWCRNNKLCIGIILSLFGFPALAAPSVFSFIDFNIAFVLGLSLPLLLLSALIKSKDKASWLNLFLLVISVLGVLFSISWSTEQQSQGILAASIVYLSILTLWPMLGVDSSAYQKPVIKYLTIAVIGIAVIYVFGVFSQSDSNAYFIWLLASSVILVLSLIRVFLLTATYKVRVARHMLLWLFTAFFASTLYLWLIDKTELIWLTLSAVAAYLIVMLNTCWGLIAQLIKQTQYASAYEKEREALLNEPSAYDPVTNLPSYAHAVNRLNEFLGQPAGSKYAVIVFKPVNFRKVNKILGHKNSDILLLQFAYCLQKHLASMENLLDFSLSNSAIRLARIQGLNFIAVMDLNQEHHPDKAIIESFCYQLMKVVPEAMSFKSFSLNFELAFGVALYDKGDSIEQLIANAGDALLNAEKNYQTIAYFDYNTSLYTEQQLLKMERLKQDLAEDRLIWRLQPQVSLETKELVGFELQVQWLYQRQQLLSLEDFVDIAEFSGELYLLGKEMLQRAFKVLAQLHQSGSYVSLSVNLSSHCLLETEIVDYIEQQLISYSLSAKYLNIEMHERVLLSSSQQAKQIVDQLKTLGVKISIADFSGSYESLRYLRKLTVNQVKVDCQHLADKQADEEKAIVNALVNLAKTMSLPVIGVNLDSATIATVFQEVGGKLAQGAIVNQGIELEQVTHWIEQWQQQYSDRLQ